MCRPLAFRTAVRASENERTNTLPVEWDLRPLHFTNEPAGGLPDVVNGVLYLPIDGVKEDPDHIRKTIHHEFYHCIQWQQFGVSSDPEWEATNLSDFVYGPGGAGALGHSSQQDGLETTHAG
jgi:hypothetical protein